MAVDVAGAAFPHSVLFIFAACMAGLAAGTVALVRGERPLVLPVAGIVVNFLLALPLVIHLPIAVAAIASA